MILVKLTMMETKDQDLEEWVELIQLICFKCSLEEEWEVILIQGLAVLEGEDVVEINISHINLHDGLSLNKGLRIN
jgi:hypothetical protein